MTEPSTTPTPQQITAYHEAGHAVIALALDRDVQRVSILPNQLRLGQCDLKKHKARKSQDPIEAEMLIFLGGPAAEARLTGEYCWGGAMQDLRHVRTLALRSAGSQKQVERIERRMLDKVEHLLSDPPVWLATQLIAEELLRSTTISGRAARHLFEQAAAKFS
jgi:ATP-dependent Zn protease